MREPQSFREMFNEPESKPIILNHKTLIIVAFAIIIFAFIRGYL